MPIGDFDREVLRLLAANRNPDSFLGGAVILHRSAESPRRSEDVDVFHDLAWDASISMRPADRSFRIPTRRSSPNSPAIAVP